MSTLKDKLNLLTTERKEKIMLRVKELIIHELAMKAFERTKIKYKNALRKLANS